MAECPACGTAVEPGEGVCPACGAPLPGATESFEPVSVQTAGGEAECRQAEGPVLVVRKGPESGERFFIDRDLLTIGRDPASDIFLNDMTVSRVHATIARSGELVTVTDAGSLNGTYVNGELADSATLQTGDVVQIGMFQMLFVGCEGGGSR